MRRVAAALLLLLVCAPAAYAAGRHGPPKYFAPPGNSALSQYLEVVPSDGGPSTPRTGAKPARVLGSRQTRELDRRGRTGRTLAAVVAATAPPSGKLTASREVSPSTSESVSRLLARSRHRPDPSRAGASTHSGSSTSGDGQAVEAPPPGSGSGHSAVSSVLAAATGREVGGGLGILLPLLVIAGVVVVVLAAVRRRAS